jgi:hypothetical protein
MKKAILKSAFIFSLLLTFSAVSFGQKSHYTIINNGNVSDISNYTEALDNAFLDKYRLKDSRRVLKFTTGVEVQLHSAQELFTNYGKKIDEQIVGSMGDTPVYQHEFALTANGKIIEQIEVVPGKMTVTKKN